ncbi:39S ribosomal protein L30, mitochondrial [Hemicordylus capensis]|uniref:39S ribosomal protein L30, mitochondrial n=1 Tax=Hemicordylus capensis TaxID=884348 RepID=UPI0023046E26|nr:39S ribosomal protein L30, mitochondrial [Hemicordylus capensis]
MRVCFVIGRSKRGCRLACRKPGSLSLVSGFKMAGRAMLLSRVAWGNSSVIWQNLAKNQVESATWRTWVRQKVTKPRIPEYVFEPQPGDHEKYGGDPQQPHKLHVVTRIKSGKGRPYWEKDLIKTLGIEKRHEPTVHKNIPSVNSKLKVIKHLIRIKPLKLPHGIPTEEEMSDTYINTSTGELIIRRHLKPAEQKTIDSS